MLKSPLLRRFLTESSITWQLDVELDGFSK